MKFSSLLLAATASVMVAATPLTASQDTSTNYANVNTVFARAECKQCSDWFDECMRSWFCWLNPNACVVTCRREMCKAIQECRDDCPGDCPPKAAEAAVEVYPLEAAGPKVEARDDCKKCDDFYNKCRGSPWCWLNPYGCDVSCRADTCRKNGDDCHNKCGYSC
ncbi:hypothetical protein HBI39_047350 [Parastagonospora nodorum]|nr:hypothetical protein HBI69_020080 [Parastagonospora nodorum]KAH6219554.1 hypothetical protein HBI53_082560 [Parastagonospora nodorum]KAH6314296.1 hypothetical protein HBI39_047350 [Parastagonospora nodorum]KAH6417340.1 hypothetical protein HBI14_105620 [Parastagonospora nodorum]